MTGAGRAAREGGPEDAARRGAYLYTIQKLSRIRAFDVRDEICTILLILATALAQISLPVSNSRPKTSVIDTLAHFSARARSGAPRRDGVRRG